MNRIHVEICSSDETDVLNGPGTELGNPDPVHANGCLKGPPSVCASLPPLTCSIPATEKRFGSSPASNARLMAAPERRGRQSKYLARVAPCLHPSFGCGEKGVGGYEVGGPAVYSAQAAP